MHLPRAHPGENQIQHMQLRASMHMLRDSDAQAERQWLAEPSPGPSQQGFEACER